jgi:hypothetical protein
MPSNFYKRLCDVLDSPKLSLELRRTTNGVFEWAKRRRRDGRDWRSQGFFERRGLTEQDAGLNEITEEIDCSTSAKPIEAIMACESLPLRDFGPILDAFSLRSKAFDHILSANILDPLGRPHMFTVDDLRDLVESHLIVREREYDQAFRRFRSGVLELVSKCSHAEPFEFARGADLTYDEWDLWQGGRNGAIELHFIGKIEEEIDNVIMAQVRGYGSRRGIAVVSKSIEAVARTAVRSCRVLRHVELAALTEPQLENQWFRDGDLDDMRDSARRYLDAFFAHPPDDGPSLIRRIHNAIHLLVEADNQSHSAVRLALCVSAIEALVCRNPKDVGMGTRNQLKHNVAVLLESESTKRPAAEEFLDGLYDRRCWLLHGENTATAPLDAEHARTIGAAVLIAVEDAIHKGRTIDPQSPDSLFDVLGAAWDRGSALDGVTQSPVARLWRSIISTEQ